MHKLQDRNRGVNVNKCGMQPASSYNEQLTTGSYFITSQGKTKVYFVWICYFTFPWGTSQCSAFEHSGVAMVCYCMWFLHKHLRPNQLSNRKRIVVSTTRSAPSCNFAQGITFYPLIQQCVLSGSIPALVGWVHFRFITGCRRRECGSGRSSRGRWHWTKAVKVPEKKSTRNFQIMRIYFSLFKCL